MESRAIKDHLYDAWATIAKALASGNRVELLDVLCQGERTVEALARVTGKWTRRLIAKRGTRVPPPPDEVQR